MINKKIIKLREERGWSQRELSSRMNKKNGGHIALVESGKRPNLSLMTACELAKAFGISLDELVQGTEFDLMEVMSSAAGEEANQAAEGDL